MMIAVAIATVEIAAEAMVEAVTVVAAADIPLLE